MLKNAEAGVYDASEYDRIPKQYQIYANAKQDRKFAGFNLLQANQPHGAITTGCHLLCHLSKPHHKISANDALLLYSDALTETPDASGECISPEAIEACLKNKTHALAFNKIIAQFKNQNTADDDLTIALLSRQA